MTEKEFYSPAQVARALGVSVTTVKRWVDAGVLPALKTVGGHRKILRAEVLRLVREGNFPYLDLGQLGIGSLPIALPPEMLAQNLYEALREGDGERTRTVIHGAYDAGMAMEEMGDAVIAPTMARLGHEWETGQIEVMHEHRSTLLCTAVLHELKPTMEQTARQDRPVAVGGNPEGDHSLLASLLIQMALLDDGWDAVNLGPHTPLASFRLAQRELRPRLMWLSASYLADAQHFFHEFQTFCQEAKDAGVAVAVGGRALQGPLPATLSGVFHGNSLTELIAFARTLNPQTGLPKRGRPAK